MSEVYPNRYPSSLAFVEQPDNAELAIRSAANSREGRIQKAALVEVAVTVLPAMALLGLGRPEVGGRVFFLVLIPLLGRHLFFKRPLEYTTLLLSVTPAIMLMREFSFYNLITILLVIGIGLWILVAPHEFVRLWRDLRWRYLLFLGVIYWSLSFFLTGSYSVNLRILELVFTVAAIWLLARQRQFLATAFLGMGLSAFAIGFAFLPYGDRLGSGEVGNYTLGNPISFGIPLALVLVVSIADNGRWLLLELHRFYRLALGLGAAGFLVLSTSRGSWAVVVACVTALMLFDKKQRRQLLLPIALLPLLIVGLLSTERGDSVEHFFEKTFSSESSLSHSTSGRSDQWVLFPRVFMGAPLIAFGPGAGKSVYARYSLEQNTFFHRGQGLAWHSLYLQLGVEAGIIGWGALLVLIVPLILNSGLNWQRFGESMPFLGILSFLVIALSVSGTDAVSGVFLGFAFLASGPARVRKLLEPAGANNFTLHNLSKELARDHLEQLQLIDGHTPGEPWTADEWLMDLPRKWEFSWLILSGEAPIGFLIASRKEEALHIHRLAVIATSRRQRLGHILMAAAAWRAVDVGCQNITLKVRDTNAGAIAFYTRLGFKVAGRQQDNLLMTAVGQQVFDLS